MVLPGFQDAHAHPAFAARNLLQLNLDHLSTRDEYLDAIVTSAAAHPDLPWITGGGWAITAFLPDGVPTKADLDAVVPDRPVFLMNTDVHSGWVNSKALQMAGWDALTPDPWDGRIERGADGEPSGALIEGAAYTFLDRFVPPTPPALWRESLLLAQRELHRTRTTPRGTVKIMLDGCPESCTAAMGSPYDGRFGDAYGRGIAFVEDEPLQQAVGALDAEGFQVHQHALGDRAVTMALDSIAAARRANGPNDARQHIAHIQISDPAGLGRLRVLGVVANLQPLWACYDEAMAEITVPRVGEERFNRMYPLADIRASGAVIAFGSDWPVSTPNVFQELEVAVTRVPPWARETPVWSPDQRIDLPAALAAFTQGSAHVNHDDQGGSLEIGKRADLVVVDRKPVRCCGWPDRRRDGGHDGGLGSRGVPPRRGLSGVSLPVVRPFDAPIEPGTKPGCALCGRFTYDPDKRGVPWVRAVAGGRQVLICPECQRERAEWAAGLDRCQKCGGTRLSAMLGQIVCRACGHTSAQAGA